MKELNINVQIGNTGVDSEFPFKWEVLINGERVDYGYEASEELAKQKTVDYIKENL